MCVGNMREMEGQLVFSDRALAARTFPFLVTSLWGFPGSAESLQEQTAAFLEQLGHQTLACHGEFAVCSSGGSGLLFLRKRAILLMTGSISR